MKYVTPSAELFRLADQDILTFSVQEEGNAASDVLSFDKLINNG